MAGWLERAVDKVLLLLIRLNSIFLVSFIALIIVIVRVLMLNLSVLALINDLTPIVALFIRLL